jgi:hypothetical protein
MALVRSLGMHHVSIDVLDWTLWNNPGKFRLTFGGAERREPDAAIKKICGLRNGCGDYVYDLTTANHHFAAGIGELILHNTDSVMIDTRIPLGPTDASCREAVQRSIIIGKGLAKRVNDGRFIKPISIEFEKILAPYLLVNKKRYAGQYWNFERVIDAVTGAESQKLKNKLYVRGLETQRRDNAEIAARSLNKLLNFLLIKRDPAGAEEYARSVVKRLVRGTSAKATADERMDIKLLTISKEYTKTPEEYHAKQPHAELAKRLAKRNPGNAPRIGDRIPYVIITTGGEKTSERAEDPEWVLDHLNECRIDVCYYLEKQLLGPWGRLLDLVKRRRGFTQGMFDCIRGSGNVDGIQRFMVHGPQTAAEAAASAAKAEAAAARPMVEHFDRGVFHEIKGLAPEGRERCRQATGGTTGILAFLRRSDGSAPVLVGGRNKKQKVAPPTVQVQAETFIKATPPPNNGPAAAADAMDIASPPQQQVEWVAVPADPDDPDTDEDDVEEELVVF